MEMQKEKHFRDSITHVTYKDCVLKAKPKTKYVRITSLYIHNVVYHYMNMRM